jgi:methylglyoxal synthase
VNRRRENTRLFHQHFEKDEKDKMAYKKITMEKDKKIALVAHDNKKRDLIEWAKFNRDLLAHHVVYATGTTGTVLQQELGFPIIRLESGPLGGDQQIGARIVDGEIDFLIFFWDPLEPMPHDPDVKALLRMAVVWNIPIACNRASADLMISSPLMDEEYDRLVPDYDTYRTRRVPVEDEIEVEEKVGTPNPVILDGNGLEK